AGAWPPEPCFSVRPCPPCLPGDTGRAPVSSLAAAPSSVSATPCLDQGSPVARAAAFLLVWQRSGHKAANYPPPRASVPWAWEAEYDRLRRRSKRAPRVEIPVGESAAPASKRRRRAGGTPRTSRAGVAVLPDAGRQSAPVAGRPEAWRGLPAPGAAGASPTACRVSFSRAPTVLRCPAPIRPTRGRRDRACPAKRRIVRGPRATEPAQPGLRRGGRDRAGEAGFAAPAASPGKPRSPVSSVDNDPGRHAISPAGGDFVPGQPGGPRRPANRTRPARAWPPPRRP